MTALFIVISTVLVALSPLASGAPDGLDWTIEKHAASERPVADNAEGAGKWFPMPDYRISFIPADGLSTVGAGAAGVVLVLSFFSLYGRLRPARPAEEKAGKNGNAL